MVEVKWSSFLGKKKAGILVKPVVIWKRIKIILEHMAVLTSKNVLKKGGWIDHQQESVVVGRRQISITILSARGRARELMGPFRISPRRRWCLISLKK
ncbi:uncharacterized protein [Aristolochia californica]|uniref:uncharacterized protein isoform X2 n=1 Tax=Aristolochia californica TaxID=171875 RepID=UPI0035E1F92C